MQKEEYHRLGEKKKNHINNAAHAIHALVEGKIFRE